MSEPYRDYLGRPCHPNQAVPQLIGQGGRSGAGVQDWRHGMPPLIGERGRDPGEKSEPQVTHFTNATTDATETGKAAPVELTEARFTCAIAAALASLWTAFLACENNDIALLVLNAIGVTKAASIEACETRKRIA